MLLRPAKAYPTPLAYAQLDALHALRGFCALYVVVFHAKYVLWSGATAYLRAYPVAGWHAAQYLGLVGDVAASAGYELVLVFFVLSGFFIRYASQARPRPAGRFYLNRLVRIYPPYLASLLLGAAVLAALAHYRPGLLTPHAPHELNPGLLAAWQALRQHPAASLGRALLFLKPGQEYFGYNAAYWSLLPEALFYLLVPLAFWRARVYYWGSAALHVAGWVATFCHLDLGLLADFLLLYNGYFALGSALYDAVAARPALLRRVAAWRPALVWAGLLGLAGLTTVLAALHRHQAAAPVAAALAVAAVLALLAGQAPPQHWLVRALRQVGLFSFSLYLFHLPLLLLAYAGLTAATGTLVSFGRWYWLAVPPVVLACWGLYWVSERRAVRYFRGV